MFRIQLPLLAVTALVVGVVLHLASLLPTPTANVVLAEKPTHVIGGQVAIVVPPDLSMAQHAVLNTAYRQAKADGHRNPELVQGVLLQESKAGAMASYKVAGNPGDQYYGLGQIKVAAARDVMNAWPELWARYKFQTRTDDELKAHLILNQPFNIEVTSKYLKLLQQRYGFQGRELLNAYNRGPAGVKLVDNQFHYALGVERHAKSVRN